ncbi:hypothetical protein H4217_002868 [Coemansia sp. RSA 1939]|nr:hypothetical protein H4217_002868 [Coemansia sp. RSA 1939]KAJ2612774.1 hypothetical protein EV177_002824 [Coemansia sp. RSA 1804]
MPIIKFTGQSQGQSHDSDAQGGAAIIEMPNNGGDGGGSGNHAGNTSPASIEPKPHAYSAAELTKPSVEIPEKLQDDFNWDETSETEEDDDDEGARKVTGFWLMHPLVRALCIMVGGGIILIIPTVAVMASHRDLPFRDTIDRNDASRHGDYNLQCVARSFALLTAIWVTGTFIYHLVDMVPDAVLRVVRMFRGKRVIEKTKDRLQFFVAIKAYVKMIVMSAVSLVCFVIMFPNASYRFIGKVENSSSSWDQVLFQINVLILFGCLIIGGEKLLLKVIATRFHRSAYKERLVQQEYASWVLDHLNRARELQHQEAAAEDHNNNNNTASHYVGGSGSNNVTFTNDAEFAASQRELLGGGGTGGYADSSGASVSDIPPPLKKRQSSSTSFWGRRSTFSGGTVGKKHKRSASRGIANRIWNIKDRALDGGIGMNSNQYAGRLARKLFSALHSDRDYLVVDDFLPYFDKEEEAIKAFEFFDKDNNGDISKREMRDRVLLVYKERRALLSALSDMGQVVGKLDMFLTAIALVIIVVIALLVFGLDALKSLATMGTLFVGWSFVFGNTFKTTFECVVFLFQVHAYDVGDTVVVATESLTVSQIRLLSTVFFKTDGTYTVYSNSQLAAMKIQNLRRSDPQSESIVVAFAFDTPTEKLHALRERMNQYCDENPRELVGPVNFSIDLLENCNRIQVSIGINYKNNWQDGGYHFGTKREFALVLRNVILDLGLRYHLPVQPVAMVPPPPSYDDLSSGTLGPDRSEQTVPSDQQQQQQQSQQPYQRRSVAGANDSDSDEDIFGSPYRPINRNNANNNNNNPGAGGAGGAHGASGNGNGGGNGGTAAAAGATAAVAGAIIASDM